MAGAAAHAEDVRRRYRALVESDENPHDWSYAWRSELNRGGFQAVDLLMAEVVDPGKCVGCAACVTVCPADVFSYADERPIDSRADACVRCVLCVDVCPVLRPPDAAMEEDLGYREPRQDEGYGPFAYELLTRTTRPEILARAQDGGLVSALLMHQLERGTIRGAVIGDVEPDNPQIGRPLLARTPGDILRSAASRYTYSPNTLALQQAMAEDVRPIALVGVPCQITGMRQQQLSSIRQEVNRWYRRNVSLQIGLLCSESFTHESLGHIGERFGVNPREIENINIKGKVIIRLAGNREEEITLKDFQSYARPACHYCLDFAADEADISVGGMGQDAWSYTIVRTETGHQALQQAIEDGWVETRDISEAKRAKRILTRLAREKRERTLPARTPAPGELHEGA